MESVTYTAVDGVSIAAHLYDAKVRKGCLLLHMMPATKESWDPFAKELLRRHVTSLAFDQRGHGESEGGPAGFKQFTNDEHMKKRFDVDASLAYLEDRGVQKQHIVLVGASIGANVALNALARNADMKAAVLLSPGLDYHGVMTKPAMNAVRTDQQVLIVASEEDEYSFSSSLALQKINPQNVTLLLKKEVGHGTDMLARDPSLFVTIIHWVVEHV